jgi:hypothetical protein
MSFEQFAFPEDTQVVSFTPNMHNTKKTTLPDLKISNRMLLAGEERKSDLKAGVSVVADEDDFLSQQQQRDGLECCLSLRK